MLVNNFSAGIIGTIITLIAFKVVGPTVQSLSTTLGAAVDGVVKAGFSAKRKKLRSSLAGGLRLEKPAVELLLSQSGISLDMRAEDLTIDQWLTLLSKYDIMKG